MKYDIAMLINVIRVIIAIRSNILKYKTFYITTQNMFVHIDLFKGFQNVSFSTLSHQRVEEIYNDSNLVLTFFLIPYTLYHRKSPAFIPPKRT